MSFRLHAVITAADLPETELWAARLDGEISVLAESFLPVGMPLDTAIRARSLAPILPARAIIELHSAAWVHGATTALPSRHTIAVHAADRSPVPRQSRLVVREVVFRRGDVINMHGIWLTSPLRTAIDLARHHTFDPGIDPPILAHLIEDAGLDLCDCTTMMNRTRNLPNKRAALNRITTALIEHRVNRNRPA